LGLAVLYMVTLATHKHTVSTARQSHCCMVMSSSLEVHGKKKNEG
jgi:hypothetical protein